MKLLIIGNRSGTNIAGSFERAAVEMGIQTRVMETRHAFNAPLLIRQFHWRLNGRRPAGLREFGDRVAGECEAWVPDLVVAMGNAPIPALALDRIRNVGSAVVNYLTDDPWSRQHRASWFLDALPRYDLVATPRRSNFGDLERLGCGRVEYLPFGFDPALFYPEEPETEEERTRLSTDLLFVGGADRERVPFLAAAIEEGLQVAIYGEYWKRYPVTRPFARGQVGADLLRRATGAARVSLCLTRRSNRDGHVMRSYEIPAANGCVLAEDTPEHRDIFGAEGEVALYFSTPPEMVAQAKLLIRAPERCHAMTEAGRARVVVQGNRYADRLAALIAWTVATEQATPLSHSARLIG